MGEGFHQLHHDNEGRRQLSAKVNERGATFASVVIAIAKRVPACITPASPELRPYKRRCHEKVDVRNFPSSVDRGSSSF